MLQTEPQVSDPETASKASDTKSDTTATKKPTKAESSAFEWEEVKKARNRINSQRIRERERAQIANLEAERARLWLSNDAIRFQNQHFREVISKVLEIREMKRNRAVFANGGMGMLGAGAPAPSAALLGGLGGASGMHMMGLDAAGLLQNPRLNGAAGKSLGGLSDADLLARHQATSMDVQSMMRKQEAMAGVGMGGLGLNNGMNMNAVAGAPFADMAESIRIRQLMLQQAGGASQADGILSSIGGAGAPSGMGSGNVGDFGNGGNGNGLSSLGGGGFGDLGNGGMDNVDLFSMNKRQKLGF